MSALKCPKPLNGNVSDFPFSDLVNGLVSLMNSNISSPVNLVSSSYPAVFHKIEAIQYRQTIHYYEMCLQGNPEEHTIFEFARLIKSLVGKASERSSSTCLFIS